MNFNYSYRAFLITSLLTGILVLFLYSVKLSKVQLQNNEETYDIEMTVEDLLPEELEMAALTPEKINIETNKAYNEAEKFISSIENENEEITETTEGKLQEMEDALNQSQNPTDKNGISETSKPNKSSKKEFSNSESKKEATAVVANGNRNTTISYQLVDRRAMDLPNPVYTCYGAGKVVINIEVNSMGRVTKTYYNKSSSTTSNGCLIDAASQYASQAIFSTDASRTKQLGSITFNFPGQN